MLVSRVSDLNQQLLQLTGLDADVWEEGKAFFRGLAESFADGRVGKPAMEMAQRDWLKGKQAQTAKAAARPRRPRPRLRRRRPPRASPSPRPRARPRRLLSARLGR